MRREPLQRKTPVYTLVMGILLGGIYVYIAVWQGGFLPNLPGILLDLLLLILLFRICAFFFAQFILPVRKMVDRLKINSRLLIHGRHANGPAIFVRNGRRVERSGESRRSGPGLVWVDTASAVVLRSESGLKQVLGPGIHFIESGDRIASTFSLHVQTCRVGPSQEESVFDQPSENASEAERKQFAQVQAKRMAVSARTRDGNEVVPEIQVVFRLNGKPASPGMPGSRFGYMKSAVEKAALAEGISSAQDSNQRVHVAWNELPGLVAIDLWREYLSKFTLDDMFSPRFAAVPEILQPEQAVPASTLPPVASIPKRGSASALLNRLNNSMESWLDKRGIQNSMEPIGEPALVPPTHPKRGGPLSFTALQIISQMIKARMMRAVVPALDECGRIVRGNIVSEEYNRLTERGLLILDVKVGGVRFDPTVEEQIVKQWNTSWLANASSDRRRVEQLELLAAQAGKQTALIEHALFLAASIQKRTPRTVETAVRTLLQATQNEILTDERIYGQGSSEVESLGKLLKWVDSGGHE